MLDEERRWSDREGVVVYDADEYMFKLKSDYYLEVKSLRNLWNVPSCTIGRFPPTTIQNARNWHVGCCSMRT